MFLLTLKQRITLKEISLENDEGLQSAVRQLLIYVPQVNSYLRISQFGKLPNNVSALLIQQEKINENEN